jgi:hypothetical protein
MCPFQESPMYQEYGHTLGRRAEYFDLPLSSVASARASQIVSQHREIFSSVYRYATPGVATEFVDGSEELSAHLVVLKSLWPVMLRYYQSPFDWYTRWLHWITLDNSKRRPQSRMHHQGDTHDLLRFVTKEIERLGLGDSDLADMVRYEELKLEARELIPAAVTNDQVLDGIEFDLNTVVVKRLDYIASPFRHDIRALLANPKIAPSEALSDIWIIATKTTGDDIVTIQIGSAGKKILEQAEKPHHVSDLIASTVLNNELGRALKLEEGLQVIQRLLQHGLIQTVSTDLTS